MNPRNEADALRTKVISIQLNDNQNGLPANGPRKRYEPAVIPTGAGWHGAGGVGLELLRAYFTIEWLSNAYTDPVPSDKAQPDTNLGCQMVNTAATIPIGGAITSVAHTFRLHRLWSWQSQDSKTEMEDAKAFAIFRRDHVCCWTGTAQPAAGSRGISAVTTTESGKEWDFTDGQGHGLVVCNPFLQLTGESIVANTHGSVALLELASSNTAKVTVHIVCRAIDVDLDTFYKCT